MMLKIATGYQLRGFEVNSFANPFEKVLGWTMLLILFTLITSSIIYLFLKGVCMWK